MLEGPAQSNWQFQFALIAPDTYISIIEKILSEAIFSWITEMIIHKVEKSRSGERREKSRTFDKGPWKTAVHPSWASRSFL